MFLDQTSEMRRRRRGGETSSLPSSSYSSSSPSSFSSLSITDGYVTHLLQDDEEKIHVPSHWYRIYSIDGICHTFVLLAIVIFAIDRVTLISAQSRSSTGSTSTLDAAYMAVQEDGSILDLTSIEQQSSVTTSGRVRSRAAVYREEFPLNLDYLTQRENVTDPYHMPPVMDLDPLEYYDDILSVEELSEHFMAFYKETPDFNTDSNVDVLEEMDIEGRVYIQEDFEDDDLADAPEYLVEYFSFDDDFNRSPHVEEDGTRTALCRKPSWYRQHHPTCNKLHEVPILNEDEYYGYYIASGGYRDVFSIYDGDAVLKIALYNREYDTDLHEMIRIDAMTMDLLAASPRIVNIYSHCAISVHVETMSGPSVEELVMPSHREDYEEEDDEEGSFPPMLNATERLQLALDMAEGLADLHGYKYGPIAHFDIQIVQFLLDQNYRPKMSDFNRAEPMLWNEYDKEYCKGWMGKASGSVRSPEEYAEEQPIDFNVDIYSFGNILYTLLTGEDPYDDDRTKAATLSVEGISPQVGPTIRGRSFAEAALASVMDKCFEYFPEKRISIFQIVSLLKDAVELNKRFESINVSRFEYHEDEEGEGESDSLDDSDDEENGDDEESWGAWIKDRILP